MPPPAVSPSTGTRMPCCVCADPWTLESDDYVEIRVHAPGQRAQQFLGAHVRCLNRVFAVEVMIDPRLDEDGQ